MNYLKEQGLQYRPLQEQLETSTSGEKLVFHVFGALAEFEGA
jgi:DNA invertase Pin-like site-specific DNA recombinase